MNLKQIFSEKDAGRYVTSFNVGDQLHYADVCLFKDGEFEVMEFYYVDDVTLEPVQVAYKEYEDVIARSLKSDLEIKH